MEEFKAYLTNNLMSFTQVSDYIVEIGGKTFELYQPAYDGALFDDDFNFVGVPMYERGEDITTECDFYAYKFGGVYYMLERGRKMLLS